MSNPSPSFDVFDYTPEILLRELSHTSSENRIKEKSHYQYLQDYFKHFQVSHDHNLEDRDISVLVEYDYIDHDYMEDFQAYYVRCKRRYKRECNRLHFFAFKFKAEDFTSLLLDKDDKRFQISDYKSSYLGFIVVKPLPYTIIGRTCLQTYKHELLKSDPKYDERFYPITRKYQVSLFGIELEVDSLAFQEQDHVVSACATSALWSAFQRTGGLFLHNIPSPVHITQGATKNVISDQRILPNNGLTLEQMIQAIQNVGLDVLAEKVGPPYSFLTKVYGYLSAGIPVILLIELVTNVEKKWPARLGSGDSLGLHAVVITGYRLPSPKELSLSSASITTFAYGITKLYVHDDQVGPFARMTIDNEYIEITNETSKQKHYSLGTSWKGGKTRAIPLNIFVPIYKKIRIPVNAIQSPILRFNRILQDCYKTGNISVPLIIWDMRLVYVQEFKKDIIKFKGNICDSVKEGVLLTNLPKYIWRVTAHVNSDHNKTKSLFDLLFDVTDIEQGDFCLGIIPHDMAFFEELKKITELEKYQPENFSSDHIVQNILGRIKGGNLINNI